MTEDRAKEGKPTYWVTHLAKQCPQQTQWLVRKKTKTAVLPSYNSENHRKAEERVARFMERQGWVVEQEVLHMYENRRFKLGHFYDLRAVQGKTMTYVEVKPRDRNYYEDQYLLAMLLLRLVGEKASYLVYEYENERFVPKTYPGDGMAKTALMAKVRESQSPQPTRVPSKGCTYCPFSECQHHPQAQPKKKDVVEEIIAELEAMLEL